MCLLRTTHDDTYMNRTPLGRFLISIFALFFWLLTTSSQAAVVLQVNLAGQVTGATGVIVDGNTYNVAFEDGTCPSLFTGCDSTSDFVFTTLSSAYSASVALLELVFIDVTGGPAFDSDPSLTFGCSSANMCHILTPYDSDGWIYDHVYASNYSTYFYVDSPTPASFYTTNRSFTDEPTWVFAVWSPVTVAAIPEPPGLALLGLAGIALAWSQRRRSSHAPVSVQ